MEENNKQIKAKANNTDKIELRSEKVQQLIGEIPPCLVRWGMAIILFIFALLIVALIYIPYPYGKEGETIFWHIINSL